MTSKTVEERALPYTLEMYSSNLENWEKAINKHKELMSDWESAIESGDLEKAIEAAKEIAIVRIDEDRLFDLVYSHSIDILEKPQVWEDFIGMYGQKSEIEEDLRQVVDDLILEIFSERSLGMFGLSGREYKVLTKKGKEFIENKRLFSIHYMKEFMKQKKAEIAQPEDKEDIEKYIR